MRFIALFAMRGPLFAAAAAAALLMAAPLIGVLVVPAGAVVALATLRHGAWEGLKVIGGAVSLVWVVRLALGSGVGAMLSLAGLVWLPAWLMAMALRLRKAQDWPLLLAALCALVYAAGMRIAVDDIAGFWQALLQPLFEVVSKDTGASFSAAQIAAFTAQVHRWSMIGMQCMLSGMVLLARWWQGTLYNPGGFGSEFRELDLPRVLALLVMVTALAFVLGDRGQRALALAGDACVILVVLFAFQGLAVLHHLARVRKLAGGWLAILYAMLMVVPQIAGSILATTGLADSFADLRRLRRRAPP